MKLFFDARFVRFPRHDGISRYSASLLTELAKQTEVTMIIYDSRQLTMLPDLPYVILNKPTSPRELFIARKLNQLGADIVVCPMQTMGSLGRRYQLILTVHDLIYYVHRTPPHNLSPLVRLGWWLFHLAYWPQRWLLNRADMIVTVSHATKQLIKKYRLTKRPVQVVSNAPSMPPQPATAHPTKNLVYMGSFMPYKNVETLVQALFYLPGYQLHCLSGISEADKRELTALAPPHQLVLHGGVSEKQYAELLSTAFAAVSASKDEGFGLPIIEAMQASVPVVCSDIGIFHEVTGTAALFFEPDNPSELAKKVLKLEDNKFRAELIKKAHHHALQYSWDNSAAELLKAIKLLVD